MRTHHRFEVTLTLLGPILTRGGQAAPAGLDAAVAVDANGFPMLPYSLVKGKVTDAVRRLNPGGFERRVVNRKPKFRATDAPLADWFGNPSADGGFDPDRGRVRFSDFVAAEKGDPTGVIDRVKIDADTGTAEGRMLMMIQAPFGYGQPVEFKGRVEFVGDAGEVAALQDVLEKAFRAVPAFGALKTVGFGRVDQEKLTIVPTAVPAADRGTPAAGAVLPVRWTPDRPLCLVGPKHSRNHFESLKSIPGAVLKGATARLLLEVCGHGGTEVTPDATVGPFPLLGKNFARVRFGEVRPVLPDGKRPVEPPLSLVVSSVEKGTWFDAALEEKPRLLHERAPRFAVDWKHDEDERVRKAFGWPTVDTERRVRTAVNADTGRAADEELFSYDLVRPGKLTWDGVIGLHDVPPADQQGVAAELARLYAHGLPHVGKTRAVAAVEWLPRPTPPKVERRPSHVVTLQTDFLMTDPDLLKAGMPLAEVYAAFWAEASGGAFELVRYFARQTLNGGYLAHRFRRGGYEPFLTTDRGSTFVLKPTGSGDAVARLEEWAERGLPLPTWAEERYGEPLWKTCPFLPHAGFGEVAIDLACHTERRLPT